MYRCRYLARNIEEFFLTGVTPSPLERTYLTTGLIEAVLQSRAAGGSWLPTPSLAKICYSPTPERVLRAKGERPTGASNGTWARVAPVLVRYLVLFFATAHQTLVKNTNAKTVILN